MFCEYQACRARRRHQLFLDLLSMYQVKKSDMIGPGLTFVDCFPLRATRFTLRTQT
jgi:hypothetical protein